MAGWVGGKKVAGTKNPCEDSPDTEPRKKHTKRTDAAVAPANGLGCSGACPQALASSKKESARITTNLGLAEQQHGSGCRVSKAKNTRCCALAAFLFIRQHTSQH